MKIEVEGQEFLIKEISYSDKLGLHGEFADVYRNGTDNVSQKDFNVLLGHTAEIAFNKPDDSLKEHEYEFQLKILIACMMEYLGLSASAKKEDGG
jgi:phage anti-repressor protein